jgi:hypothetical protein
MAFLSHREDRKLSGFHNSMMVGPGILKLVSQEFDSRGLSLRQQHRIHRSSRECSSSYFSLVLF